MSGLVEAARYTTRVEADLARLYLESEGVEAVLLFTQLGDDEQVIYAQKHRDVVARFGRFPHRNALLGRAPRPDEIAAGDVFPW